MPSTSVSADLEYPNKDLVVFGTDGRSANSKFDSESHYGQIYNKKHMADTSNTAPAPVSGSFAPVLTYSQFLTRHAPHPFRVRHMKGLLDMPICNVVDEVPDVQQTSRFHRSISTPERAKTYFNGRVPMDQMDVAMRLKDPKKLVENHSWGKTAPVSTTTRDYKMPQISKIDPTWHVELTQLTQRSLSKQSDSKPTPQVPKQQSAYSRQTGRLNEGAPSHSRMKGTVTSQLDMVDSMKEFGMESEALVMELLSQMLGTRSTTAIQTWLCNATQKEKGIVAERVRQVVEEEMHRRTEAD